MLFIAIILFNLFVAYSRHVTYLVLLVPVLEHKTLTVSHHLSTSLATLTAVSQERPKVSSSFVMAHRQMQLADFSNKIKGTGIPRLILLKWVFQNVLRMI